MRATPNKNAEGETTKIPSETQTIETNVPDINDFNAFQRELNLVNIRTRNEEQRWLGPMEKKQDQLRAMDELVAAELRFIRKLAESEHAEETTKAIDLVLKQRQDRLKKLITKLEEEPRQERQPQTERRKLNRAGGQDQPIKERPQRKIREVNTNDGQMN
jgi:vacuolar-type H+-ATPase subunit I/STV1